MLLFLFKFGVEKSRLLLITAYFIPCWPKAAPIN